MRKLYYLWMFSQSLLSSLELVRIHIFNGKFNLVEEKEGV